MTDILPFQTKADIEQCLLWQYTNSASLRTLLQKKQAWLLANHTRFWEDWYNQVFNLDTATDFGLQVWGEILDFPRQITGNDGELHILTQEQYRAVLKGQMLKFRMGATAPEVNRWLKTVFGQYGGVYCLDNLDMTFVPFVFQYEPDPQILWLLSNFDFLPRPAGVGYKVNIVPSNTFGFNGSGLETFNNGIFAYDWAGDLEGEQNLFQLTIQAPAGAEVTINGRPASYATLAKASAYSWEVKQAGYISAQGTGIITEDTVVLIKQLTVLAPASAQVTLNGRAANGAFFSGLLEYSVQVSQDGFLSAQIEGVAQTDAVLTAQIFQIETDLPEADVTLNSQRGCKNAYFFNSFTYQAEVTADGYQPFTQSGTVYENTVLHVAMQPVEFSHARYNIGQSIGRGQITVGSYILPVSGRYYITIAGGGHGPDRTEPHKVSRGGISVIEGTLQRDDIVRFDAVSAGKGNAGVGMAVYVNSALVAVSGGGGYVDDDNTSFGGDGFIGGGVKTKNTPSGVNGYGMIEGVNQTANQGAYGSYNRFYHSGENRKAEAWGGSGFAVANDARFTITQIYGVENRQGNDAGAYFIINLNNRS